MALVRDKYRLNWPVGIGAGRIGRTGKLWRVGKSKEVGFKARKKLIARKRECSTMMGRSRAENCSRVVVSGGKDLRFIGREFHKRGEELRNDLSPNFSLVETGGRERHR